MPYLRLLERLLASVPGAQGALLLDAMGEVVVEAGARDDRHRLIGAYQGIALSAAQRASANHDGGALFCIVCRYSLGSVILRPLKDGYYFVVALTPEANLWRGIRASAETQAELNAEL